MVSDHAITSYQFGDIYGNAAEDFNPNVRCDLYSYHIIVLSRFLEYMYQYFFFSDLISHGTRVIEKLMRPVD